jgi:NitT/TauT family transport system permease protein
MSNIPSERSLPVGFLNGFSLKVNSLLGRSSDMTKEPFSARKRYQVFRRILSIVLFFGIWQILCMVKFNFWVNFSFLPSPLEVSEATVKFFSTNALIHIQSSVIRVLAGYFFFVSHIVDIMRRNRIALR